MVVAKMRARFDAQTLLKKNKMCGAVHLIGAFEFTSSNPDGADPKNPGRPCPDSPAVP